MAFRERILGLVRGSINAKGQLTHDPVPRAAASVASRQVTRSHIAACVRAEPPDLQLHLPVLLRREANPAAVDAWAGHGVVDCVADSDRGCPLCHPSIYLSIYLSIYPSIYLSRACSYGEPRPLSRCSGKVEAGKLTRTAGTMTRASCTAASRAGSTVCGGCAMCSGAAPSARRTSIALGCTSGRCSTSQVP